MNGIQGVDAWKLPNADNPSVTINATRQPVAITTLTLPAESVSVHPSPKAGVGVAWQSPISGTVSVRVSIADSDDKCGDGVNYSLHLKTALTRKELATGGIPNGGKTELTGTNLLNLHVKAGDQLQLMISPKGGYECDTTTIDLHIVQLNGGSNQWDLAKEVVLAEHYQSGW